VALDDIEKTAFIRIDGLWVLLLMPHGIETTSAWFMCMIADALKKHICKGYYLVFIDDISITSDTAEKHGQHVRAVMDTHRKNSFRQKDRKCTFGRTETEFVGYWDTRSGVGIPE
jgi:hypothetical protein